jgi:group I intron endonuclease
MVGIYKITSPSGNVYIGQSRNIKKRWEAYREYKKIKKQPAICRSFEKYGIDSHVFEVIHEVTDVNNLDILNELEIFYIKLYTELGCTMLNIDQGGRNSKKSPETRAKIGLSKIGNKNNLGRYKSEETKKKISETKKGNSPAWNKGIPWPEEVKKKMYKFPKGFKPWNTGKKWGDDTKQKMREAKLGRILSEETKSKMRIAQQERRKSEKIII